MENELEQTLKKINILDWKSGSRGRSTSQTKVQKTEFKPVISRKPLNNRTNVTPPSKRVPSVEKKKSNYSPSSASALSKGKNSKNASPGINWLYSPSGRPRLNSPSG